MKKKRPEFSKMNKKRPEFSKKVRNFWLHLFFSFHFNLSGMLFFFVMICKSNMDYINLFFSGLFQISGKSFRDRVDSVVSGMGTWYMYGLHRNIAI